MNMRAVVPPSDRAGIPTPREWGLTASEREILDVLMHRQLASTDAIVARLYHSKGQDEPESTVVPVLVHHLRRKLETRGIELQTARGEGWYLDAATKARVRDLSGPTETPLSAAAAPPPKPAASSPVPLPDGAIELGGAEDTAASIGLILPKLLEGRLLVQGASGAGKSWTLRRLLERTAAAVQQVVVDPEGEFREFAERYGHFVLHAHQLDAVAIGAAMQRARTHRISILLDVSEVDREAQMKAVSAALQALIEAPREEWNPILVAIDEAHLFAPFGGQAAESNAVRKSAIAAITDLMSRGRKRGLCGVLATQRLARMAKSVVSEAQNFLIGLNTLDLDIRRAAETIGWDARRAFDRLPLLEAGSFVAVGPAFSRSPVVIRVGAVETCHVGAAPSLPAPLRVAPAQAADLLDLDALLEASQADREIRESTTLMPGLKAVRGFIRDPAFIAAGRIWGALKPLAPEGARVDELAPYLEIGPEDVAAGLALLDGYGVVDFDGEGSKRAVRVERGMRT